MKKFFSDFKAFITKGNVVDMAIGVVIGGAFKDIVNALVANIITPFIGLLLGGSDLSDQKYILQKEVVEIVDGVETVTTPENAVLWGAFLQTVIDFLIIAFTIFVVIKVAMTVHNKAENKKRKLLQKKLPQSLRSAQQINCLSKFAICSKKTTKQNNQVVCLTYFIRASRSLGSLFSVTSSNKMFKISPTFAPSGTPHAITSLPEIAKSAK